MQRSARLWTALDQEPTEIAAAFRAPAGPCCGARPGSVRHALVRRRPGWSVVDRASVGREDGLAHRFPLSGLAMEILTGLRDRVDGGRGASIHVLANARGPKRRAVVNRRLRLRDFRGHDLRRAAASRMASAGVPRLVIGKVLNHAAPGATAVYDRHTYDSDKRAALETWAWDLASVARGHPRQVLAAGRRTVRVANRRHGTAVAPPTAGPGKQRGLHRDRRRPRASTARPPLSDGRPRQAVPNQSPRSSVAAIAPATLSSRDPRGFEATLADWSRASRTVK